MRLPTGDRKAVAIIIVGVAVALGFIIWAMVQ